tara:strand:- start:1559 stop:2065 length:507 start_codon:yes stop_codon:yes gene_type:complete
VDEISQDESGRIDLSHFSGMTEGKWEIIDTPGGGIDVGVKLGRHEPCAHQPVITFTQRLANIVRKSERDMADLRAIAAVPELISEVRTCYAIIDRLSDRIDGLTTSSTAEELKGLSIRYTALTAQVKLDRIQRNRDIEEVIDCLDGVDSVFGEEVIGMLRPLLRSVSE